MRTRLYLPRVDDIKWHALTGLAAVNPEIKLPEQGKFNAAEKINFMVLMVTCPLYAATSLLMWLAPLATLHQAHEAPDEPPPEETGAILSSLVDPAA